MGTETGKVYVVHNEWIQNPEAEEGATTYKIGMTTTTVDKRYYGLGLKMPGEFECDFAYEFNGEKYREVEKTLKKILSKSRVGGEWFDLDADSYDGVQSVCEIAGGKLVTEAVEEEIEEEAEGGDAVEIHPVLEKVVNRWNAVSDMKAAGRGTQTRKIHIPEIGSIGRGTVYFFTVWSDKPVHIGLRCCGLGRKYPAVTGLFEKPIQVKGSIFDRLRAGKYTLQIITTVPATDVDRAVETMKSLIEATKETIVGGWGKE
jgi:hypothetical protein